MGKPKVEKFSLRAIADAVSRSDVARARVALSAVIGAVLDVSGRVRKVVKRQGQEKLVIEPGDVPGFVVFAHFPEKSETLKKAKIRKGSAVTVRGRLASFGASGANLDGAKLQELQFPKKGSSDKIGHSKKREVT